MINVYMCCIFLFVCLFVFAYTSLVSLPCMYKANIFLFWLYHWFCLFKTFQSLNIFEGKKSILFYLFSTQIKGVKKGEKKTESGIYENMMSTLKWYIYSLKLESWMFNANPIGRLMATDCPLCIFWKAIVQIS